MGSRWGESREGGCCFWTFAWQAEEVRETRTNAAQLAGSVHELCLRMRHASLRASTLEGLAQRARRCTGRSSSCGSFVRQAS